MSVYGWISIAVLLLFMILSVIKMLKQVPEHGIGKRALALTPLAILFVLFAPKICCMKMKPYQP